VPWDSIRTVPHIMRWRNKCLWALKERVGRGNFSFFSSERENRLVRARESKILSRIHSSASHTYTHAQIHKHCDTHTHIHEHFFHFTYIHTCTHTHTLRIVSLSNPKTFTSRHVRETLDCFSHIFKSCLSGAPRHLSLPMRERDNQTVRQIDSALGLCSL